MAEKDLFGRAGEDRAARYLQSLGYAVLERNWRCTAGEIDLVVGRANELVIVEVKTRRSERFGHPFEAIDAAKRARLWRLGNAWVAQHRRQAQGRQMRIDAIGVTGADPETALLEHLEDVDVA
ncbi:YraN family protein [Microbacterium sp. NPDC076911]|uniref:YraN family protein n=1 Tax=Microbacterium sp. NPDC076911 TaxID=3154958 RepID=UPI0034252FE4